MLDIDSPTAVLEAPPATRQTTAADLSSLRPERRGRRTKKLWWIVAVIVVALAGTGVFFWTRGPKPTVVHVGTVVREDIQAKVTANGRIQAQKKVDISATVAGQVTTIAVEEGDKVEKGQLLLQIDAASPKAAALSNEASMEALIRDLDAARVNRDQARRDLRRIEESHRASIISIAELDRAKASLAASEASVSATERRVEQARAMLDGAKDALRKTRVLAPMDGIVTARRVEEGEVAVVGVLNQPGTVLMTISDMSVVEAELEVDETSIPSVKIGQEALIRLDAYGNKTFDGSVTEVGQSPIVRLEGPVQEAVKFKVKVQMKSPPEGIKPGLTAQADILTAFRPQALVVPFQALVVRDIERKPGSPAPAPGAPRDEEGVYVLDDGKARFQPIETGLLGDVTVEVLRGLQGGETIVKGPFSTLRSLKPGDHVRVEEEPEDDAVTQR